MGTTDAEVVKDVVRQAYGRIARGEQSGGCCGSSACCGTPETPSSDIGYSPAEIEAAPDGANLGLGCGNPQAIAALQPGERVLDLGSGAGFDAFLAARQVGPAGRVIGVDMTPEMVSKARANAAKASFDNVEFRLGEIEKLPIADASVDVIMSNCVINLSPDKPAVFREAFRVLAPGGRLAISDVVATHPVPPALRDDLAAYAGCITGAALAADVERMLVEAGFDAVRLTFKDSRALVSGWMPGSKAEDYVASALIEAVKPAGGAAAEAPTACCDSVLLDTCCPPDAKAGCCSPDAHADGTCGCR
jgi:SAM-dependent methyltransferase